MGVKDASGCGSEAPFTSGEEWAMLYNRQLKINHSPHYSIATAVPQPEIGMKG
jgi:hypothetical protein